MINILNQILTYLSELKEDNGYSFDYTVNPKYNPERDISFYSNDSFPIIGVEPNAEITKLDENSEYSSGTGGSVVYTTDWKIYVFPLIGEDWFANYSVITDDLFKLVNKYCSLNNKAISWQITSINDESNDQESVYKVYIYTIKITFEMEY